MMSAFALTGSAVGLTCGVILRSFFFVPPAAVSALLISSVLAYLLSRSSTHVCSGKNFFLALSLFFLCGACGVWRMDVVRTHFDEQRESVKQYESKTVVVEGVIAEDPETRESGVVLVVLTDSIGKEAVHTRVRVSTSSGTPVVYGDRVRAEGVLKVPEAFETDLGRTFFYAEYLRASHVTHTISFGKVSVTDPAEDMSILRMLFSIKHALIGSIGSVLPEPHAGFATGLLLGEKNALGKELEDVFRKVGVIHIVVLSGYNLTILAEALMHLLSYTLTPRRRALVGIVVVSLFALMVGLSATVLRAAIMASLALFARATGRSYVALRGLCYAGMGMVIFNPYVLLYDPGFQLSFLATLGLIFGSPLVDKAVSWVPTRFQIREYVTATLATQLFVTPFLMYTMGTVSLVALVANVLILSAVPPAMLTAFVAGVLALVIGTYALPLAYPAYLLLSYMLFVAEYLSSFRFASIMVPVFSFWYVTGAYVVLGGGLLYAWQRGFYETKEDKTAKRA